MGGRAEIFKAQIEFYSCMINNLERNLLSINYWFSRFSNKSYNFYSELGNMIKNLTAAEMQSLTLKPILLDIREKADPEDKKIVVLDPLDKGRK